MQPLTLGLDPRQQSYLPPCSIPSRCLAARFRSSFFGLLWRLSISRSTSGSSISERLDSPLDMSEGIFSDAKARGEISHFKAVTTAISGTVGVGNIGGVAVAISLGGPGAAFWLFIAGVLAMATKLVECTLGVKYRRYNADGSVSGGPMYYLEAWFNRNNLPTIGKAMGIFYAVAMVIGCFGIGNMFQANQAYMQVLVITGGESSWLAAKGWVFGLALATIVALVVIGGIRSIARVTSVLVPFMAALVHRECCYRHRVERRAYSRSPFIGGGPVPSILTPQPAAHWVPP